MFVPVPVYTMMSKENTSSINLKFSCSIFKTIFFLLAECIFMKNNNEIKLFELKNRMRKVKKFIGNLEPIICKIGLGHFIFHLASDIYK